MSLVEPFSRPGELILLSGLVMSSHWNTIVDVLREEHHVEFDAGLSDAELDSCESEFNIRFPPDLRSFLKCALPISERFPNWRSGSRDELKSWLDLPVEGILFDVEQNGFWLPEWGEQPQELEAAKIVVRNLVTNAPKLIPIYAHRMIPDRPHAEGNPVFSVHQTDIIYYGCDLRDYFIHEFFSRSDLGIWPITVQSLRPIEFWDLDRFATRWERGPNIFDGSKKTMR